MSVRHASGLKRACDACAQRRTAFPCGQHVPGVHIPEAVLQCIAGADNQKAEAKMVLLETIRVVSEVEGVAGVHLMGYRNDEMLAEAITKSGICIGVSTRAA